jgi:hypothetical protein
LENPEEKVHFFVSYPATVASGYSEVMAVLLERHD